MDVNYELLSNLSSTKGEVYVCRFDNICITHASTALEKISKTSLFKRGGEVHCHYSIDVGTLLLTYI